MSDSLGSLLSQRELFEPPEIKLIQAFIVQKFNVTPRVQVSATQIIVLVPGAAFAGALRPYTPQLQQAAQTTKKIIIRIHG